MTDDFIVDLKDYIRVERKYPHEAWCDPDDVQAALDEIERLREAIARKDAALWRIADDANYGSDGTWSDDSYPDEIARAALKEKTDG